MVLVESCRGAVGRVGWVMQWWGGSCRGGVGHKWVGQWEKFMRGWGGLGHVGVGHTGVG